MRAQDGGRGNTSMTLVGITPPRNRNELVSLFIRISACLGDVTVCERFGPRCRCDACGAHYLIDGNCAADYRNRYRLTG
jgi:hypothetical protein